MTATYLNKMVFRSRTNLTNMSKKDLQDFIQEKIKQNEGRPCAVCDRFHDGNVKAIFPENESRMFFISICNDCLSQVSEVANFIKEYIKNFES